MASLVSGTFQMPVPKSPSRVFPFELRRENKIKDSPTAEENDLLMIGLEIEKNK